MMQANARSVNVTRKDLLAKLIENRKNHLVQYRKALEAYQVDIVRQVEELLAQAKSLKLNDGLYIHESPPENHTSDYDEVIAMMEMSVDETINLDSNSFKQYVLDDWAWKQSFTATSTKYISNVAGRK